MRAHFITSFTLPFILDLWIPFTNKIHTFSGVAALAWRAVYVVLFWAGNMTGDKRIARFHGCIGSSSMLFDQSVLRRSKSLVSSKARRSDLNLEIESRRFR